MQRLSWGQSLKSYLFLHRRPIPRSWQFGANLGGEGQKLPQNCRLGGGGRCENDPPFFAQVAADARSEVSKSVQAKDLWSVGTLASWNFTFCVLSDCNPTLSPLSPDVWLFIPAREMAISIPMGGMWCSRSNPWPSRVVPSSLLAFTFNTQFLHRCISFLSLAKQCSVSKKMVATALTFLDFNIDAHGSAGQEVTPDPNVHRPRSHIVNLMAVHVLQGCQFFFLWWATQCFPGMVACVLYSQHCTHSGRTTERRFLAKSANCQIVCSRLLCGVTMRLFRENKDNAGLA